MQAKTRLPFRLPLSACCLYQAGFPLERRTIAQHGLIPFKIKAVSYTHLVQEYCSLLYNNIKDVKNRPEGFYELLTE